MRSISSDLKKAQARQMKFGDRAVFFGLFVCSDAVFFAAYCVRFVAICDNDHCLSKPRRSQARSLFTCQHSAMTAPSNSSLLVNQCLLIGPCPRIHAEHEINTCVYLMLNIQSAG